MGHLFMLRDSKKESKIYENSFLKNGLLKLNVARFQIYNLDKMGSKSNVSEMVIDELLYIDYTKKSI